MSYKTQSVVIPKKYMNLTKAKKWIKNNDYHMDYGIDEKVNVWRFRQRLPKYLNHIKHLYYLMVFN